MNRMADALKHHETKLIAASLLIPVHQCEHIIMCHCSGRSSPEIPTTNDDSPRDPDRCTQKMRQFGRIHATDRHRITMTPAEMLKLLDGMTERMP